jgi:hypothetical protein
MHSAGTASSPGIKSTGAKFTRAHSSDARHLVFIPFRMAGFWSHHWDFSNTAVFKGGLLVLVDVYQSPGTPGDLLFTGE